MASLAGKTVLITGAARAQGRSHAVTLAEQGADIIALDICRNIESLGYDLATSEELDETVAAVRALGRSAVGVQADVRDADAVRAAVAEGVETVGEIDILIANAGVAAHGNLYPDQERLFSDVLDVNVRGVWNSVQAVAPRMIERGRGGAIALISSSNGLSGAGGNGTAGADAYIASKHAVVGLMRSSARWLAAHHIRVNSVHPTGVPTPMVMNEDTQRYLMSEERIGQEMSNLLPVPMIEAVDISRALAWLVSDDARYVTGVALPVDAGCVTP